ncbi:GntR family transcriptional regulator, partial [Burkholderia sola]|uniref:GntR family transcriptional regulator n=1 Tax=Burkholderia sola TaxID=2843302 RepID=UPI0033901233
MLAQKLAPGERRGEQELADNFAVSRTMVREALMQLQARGFVQVQPRRGWYVVQPSAEEAQDAFAARRIIETGILGEAGRPLQSVIGQLRRHIAQEQDAIAGADAATRAFLLADFHVCLAEQMGHRLLALTLRDLTARTTLAATLFQSTHSASQSCAEHERIVEALERGDTETTRVNLERMAQLADRMGRITGQLRNFARKSSGASQAVPLAHALDNALAVLE